MRSTLERAAEQVHRMEAIELTLAQSGAAADSSLARELRAIGDEYVTNLRLLLTELDETD